MTLTKLNKEIIHCRKCPRLVAWREQVAREKRRAYQDWEYWGKPVPGFGDPHARVFVVGLAPGAHGSNRTGRQFTGDASGDFLYPALNRAGFASQPESTHRGDGLVLTDLYTAPVCRCAPPENKPTQQEMLNCQSYLVRELTIIKPKVIVVLGRIAFDSIIRIYSVRNPGWKFSHAAQFQLPDGNWMLCSYHPSQQNTLTGRLTVPMFDQIWKFAWQLAGK
jgi:uracil-DNA glycosylase family 4